MKIVLKRQWAIFLAGLTTLIAVQSASAQQWGNSSAVSDPFEGQYFINRYLANPAMAGLDSTLKLNAAYRQQFSGVPGAPVSEVFTADDNPGRRVGIGLIAYNDKAGLINQTRFALSYAYHLPVGQFGEQLHFGISGAFEHRQFDPKGIVGDQDDPAVTEFNGHKNVFDVDYGMAYTDQHMTLQASISNLFGFLQKFNNTTTDASTLYAAAAYKFIFDGVVNSIEPQVSILGVKNYNSIVYTGANVTLFRHVLNLYGMYHSSGYFSTGVGLNYKNVIHMQGTYLSQTKGLQNYTDGSYEIDLTLSIGRHK